MICKNCNAEIPEDSLLCPNCGQPANGEPVVSSTGSAINISGKPKSKLVAGLLAFFIGTFGIHNFYLGYNKKGFIQLGLTAASLILSCCTFGVSLFIYIGVWIWSIADCVMIFIGKINVDANGISLE